MKQLLKHFIGRGEVKDFKFTQIKCSEQAFLYEVDTGDTKYYEVFKKRRNRRFGNISYPSSYAFGIWAWTYVSLEQAEKKFQEINTNELC